MQYCRILLISFLALSAPSLAEKVDKKAAAIGGGAGGAIGAVVGDELGDRNGAILGSAIGAAVGTAIATADGSKQDHPIVIEVDPSLVVIKKGKSHKKRSHKKHHHCPPGQAKKDRC